MKGNDHVCIEQNAVGNNIKHIVYFRLSGRNSEQKLM